MKTKLVEIHYSRDIPVNYLRDKFNPGRPEMETQWFIRRTLFKKVTFFWVMIVTQTLRMETNQAIHACCFGTQYDYSPTWKSKLVGTPDKTIYK